MRALNAIMAGCGVCLVSLAVLCPFIIFPTPTPGEVWMLQALREMQGFVLVPLLNGAALKDLNPLQFQLLALLQGTIAAGRLTMILAGLVLTAALFLFARALWDTRTGVFAALFGATSLGFLKDFSLLNTVALPCTLAVLAYLLFAWAYLRERHGGWYVVAYLLLALATATGGLALAMFFIGAAVLLVLLDVAPQRLASIRPLFGLGLLAVVLAASYLVYRFAAGPSALGGVFLPGKDLDLTDSLGALAYATLPWLPLIVPAWIASARPAQWQDWRDLLPAKIAMVMTLLVLWLSGRCQTGYAVLAVPFAALMCGHWAARGMPMPIKAARVRGAAFVLTAVIIAVFPVVHLARNARAVMAMHAPEAGILAGLFLCLVGFFALIGKKAYRPATYAAMLAVLALAWHAPLAWQYRTPPAPAIAGMARFHPLLVLEDDLVMRGYMAQAGAHPVVVGRAFVPVGTPAYLAVATKDLADLREACAGRMRVQILSVAKRDTTYALLRVTPLNP